MINASRPICTVANRLTACHAYYYIIEAIKYFFDCSYTYYLEINLIQITQLFYLI